MRRTVEFKMTAPDDGVLLGDFTEEIDFDSVGELFKTLSKEFGKCISKVYLDGPDGKVSELGWVFQKREKYEDCNDTYLKNTWCTVVKEEIPMRRVSYSLNELKKEMSDE